MTYEHNAAFLLFLKIIFIVKIKIKFLWFLKN